MKAPFIHAGILCIALAAGGAGADGTQSPAAPTGLASPAVAVADPPYLDPYPAAVSATPAQLLDLAALKTRLRNTQAIGVFAKLALKRQLDDLLQQFRSHHTGGRRTSVASLRQAYELLLHSVLAQVQHGDPPLARSISESREAIWIILADPEQFESAG
jgi:hypothetical protein